MILTLLALSLLSKGTPETVADYFPMVPGTIRTYEETDAENRTTENQEVVGEPVFVGKTATNPGVEATPFLTRVNGRVITTTYYRIADNTVYLVGYSATEALPDPIPTLRLEGPSSKWSFTGAASNDKATELIRLTGEANRRKEERFIGKFVAVAQSKISATVGDGPGQERIEQVATYGNGIGMVRLDTTTRIGKHKASVTRRLIRIEEAKAHG